MIPEPELVVVEVTDTVEPVEDTVELVDTEEPLEETLVLKVDEELVSLPLVVLVLVPVLDKLLDCELDVSEVLMD